MSYLVLLLVIKNSQCFNNLYHVPNTVLRTCIELINLCKISIRWILLLTPFIDEETEAVNVLSPMLGIFHAYFQVIFIKTNGYF